VMNKQRQVIYGERQAVLKGEDIHQDILRFIRETVTSYIRGAQNGSDKPQDWDADGLWKALASVYPISLDQDETMDSLESLKGDKAVKALADKIVEDAESIYQKREDELGEKGSRQLERQVVLSVLDSKWREHLYEMDYLKDGIGLRGMGQRDPLVEYQREGYQMYNSMIDAIKEESVQLLFNVDLAQIAASQEAEELARKQESEQEGEDLTDQDAEEDASEEVSYTAPQDPDTADEDAEIDEVDGQKSGNEDLSDQDERGSAVVGPEPLSHADGKVPVNKRPKAEEEHSPWSDGRTFPGTSKNAPCPCGSGRKYKMCHGQNEM
ncbi:MAG: SEC-C metal-binding domain-containing protein, partial [Bifidobacteriales bacterium]|nr:SEC-C metal-binding domain-containing protein [Bifidobacteriales bacterium]